VRCEKQRTFEIDKRKLENTVRKIEVIYRADRREQWPKLKETGYVFGFLRKRTFLFGDA